MLKVASFNVNGIRSTVKKGFNNWLLANDLDVICLQEIRADRQQFIKAINAPGFYQYSLPAEKKGYSGVAILSKKKPSCVYYGMSNNLMTTEGRLIGIRIENLLIMSLYMPSGTSGEERQNIKYKLMEELQLELARLKALGLDLIICGDWNIAHTKMDIKNWKSNEKNSGFLPDERDYMSKLFDSMFVDAYRVVEPDTVAYSWWSNRGNARANNVGWRIDYQVISKSLEDQVISAEIHSTPMLSDHAPVIINYAI
jgi:exodeoxyribonuclease-3